MNVRIAEAGNTSWGISLRILAERGFTVVSGPDPDPSDFWAIDEAGRSLVGSSPLVLLGLLGILDHRGDDWYRAPRLPADPPRRAGVVDLTPQGLARCPEEELEWAAAAFRRLAALRRRDIGPLGDRDALITAANRWIETTRSAAAD